MKFILTSSDRLENFGKSGGGKATNLARLSRSGFLVPPWFCISTEGFEQFVVHNNIKEKLVVEGNIIEFSQAVENLFLSCGFPRALEEEVFTQLSKMGLQDKFVAVRSSGTLEDSAANSFAGQFSSFLAQKGETEISASIKKCWASGFSERVLSYRIERGLPLTNIQIAVVIQLMVNADVAGVAFSRNPVKTLDRENLTIDSLWGLGEGLVNGELDADHFEINRETLEISPVIAKKTHALKQAPQGGLIKTNLADSNKEKPSLNDEQVKKVASLVLDLEEKIGSPQDCEWAFAGGRLYCLQTRPITTLPPEEFYNSSVNGDKPVLWDNSNIIESYSGVTSPLTFTFASNAYRQVYIQFCEIMGVSKDVIGAHDSMYRNMLGIIRGRIYYNLINWYRLALMLPGASNNKGFMETMMGVKQTLKPELASLFDFVKNPPRYSLWRKLIVTVMTIYRFIKIDQIVGEFRVHFESVYNRSRKIDFKTLSLTEQVEQYQYLEEQILKRWHAPIINDYLCMIFFGLLKKLTERWIAMGEVGSSLQNDLLCGEGDIESTEPTKMLMRIAKKIDKGDKTVRQWFISATPSQIWEELNGQNRAPEILAMLDEFLDRYGFRCVNELKLEEPDLHDDPSFAISVISGYIKMKTYSIKVMEEGEIEIRSKAETLVREKLSGYRKVFYFWILKQARRAVKTRENLRFARTKIFGVVRHLFRAMGENFVRLGILTDSHDIFYLTIDEITSFVEGRSATVNLGVLAAERKKEYEAYRNTPPPPDRFLTYGAAGSSIGYSQVLADADLLGTETPISTDPNVLLGTPCCPGTIEGVVRVAKDLKDAQGLDGEILVTQRTDPGWVPLYPSCSGLLIERGSLLSHSAVVARELGLPTIVGISGGLMNRLKTGQHVRVDAGKGEIRILP